MSHRKQICQNRPIHHKQRQIADDPTGAIVAIVAAVAVLPNRAARRICTGTRWCSTGGRVVGTLFQERARAAVIVINSVTVIGLDVGAVVTLRLGVAVHVLSCHAISLLVTGASYRAVVWVVCALLAKGLRAAVVSVDRVALGWRDVCNQNRSINHRGKYVKVERCFYQ